jgi:hypothetical protein
MSKSRIFPTQRQAIAISTLANALQVAATLATYVQRCATANQEDLSKLVFELRRAAAAADVLRQTNTKVGA